MPGRGEGRRFEREARGFLPRADGASPRWRRVRDWVLAGREEMDQQGLLAERTLVAEPRSERDEARR